MTRPIAGGCCCAFLMAFRIFGQPAPEAFEVASVKIHEGPLTRILGFSSSGPRVAMEGYPAIGLVMEAFNLKNYQVSFAGPVPGGDDTYYDIVAIAAGNRTPGRDEFRHMLQTLLAERFHLKTHHEMKEIRFTRWSWVNADPGLWRVRPAQVSRPTTE